MQEEIDMYIEHIPSEGIVCPLSLLDLFLLQQATTHVTMNMTQLIISSEANTPDEAIQAPGISLDPSDTVCTSLHTECNRDILYADKSRIKSL